MKLPDNMAEHYDHGYFNQHLRPFRKQDGTEGQYQGPARDWHGFDLAVGALLGLLDQALPQTALDVGCGPGGFVRALCAKSIHARGVDFSEYAVANPTRGVDGLLSHCDVTREALPGGPYDLVSAVDFLEHIYLKDIPAVVQHIVDASSRWIFLLVSTALESETWHAVPGEDIPADREWQAVSGHVTCMPASWWNALVAAIPGVTVRTDLGDRFEGWRTWHREMRHVEGWKRSNVIIAEVRR